MHEVNNKAPASPCIYFLAARVVAVAAVQLHPKQAGLLKKMRNPLFDYTKFRL